MFQKLSYLCFNIEYDEKQTPKRMKIMKRKPLIITRNYLWEKDPLRR